MRLVDSVQPSGEFSLYLASARRSAVDAARDNTGTPSTKPAHLLITTPSIAHCDS
jgi:hypothetical protein